ncbi:MAG: Holliday junction branch migration protein RuvA, partial [Coriobacteriia bacterium]|nr:Holliday junction branch migration protein RuvA [Coriobacteriia bacterium]
MIALLTGRVVERGASHAVIDVAGVGYRMAMSTASLAALPSGSDTVTVHTHLHVREDELSLFGFGSASEKALFERLITVTGVGPKVALAALSSFDPATLADAIVREDVDLISQVPGVGKKTAQRICLDLKDKLTLIGAPVAPGSASGPAGTSTTASVREALLNMGFSPAEIAA